MVLIKRLIGKGVTDMDGECSVIYNSKGAGDVNIQVECMGLQETYVLQDLILYRASVSSSDTFNISLPSHFEITSTVNKTSTTGAYCYYRTDNDYDMGSLRGNGSISVRRGSNLFVDKNSSIIKYNEPTTLSYEYDNGTHTISANNQSASGTNSISLGNFKSIYIENYTITDLKIKPL